MDLFRVVFPLTSIPLLAGCDPQGGLLSDAPATSSMTINHEVTAGKATKVEWFYSLNTDCSERAGVAGRVVRPAAHGVVELAHGQDLPNFAVESEYAHCNSAQVPAWEVTYTPQPGFLGRDNFSYDELFPDGVVTHVEITIDVK